MISCSDEKFLAEDKIPVIGYYDFLQDKTYIYEDLTYPIKRPIKVFNYPDNVTFRTMDIIPEKNEVFLNFSFSPYVYRINLEKNQRELIPLISKLPDTSWVYKNTEKGYDYMFYKVYYVKSLEKYIRYVTIIRDNEYIRSLVTYDEKFNYIGEHITDVKFKYISGKFSYLDIVNDSLILEYFVPKEVEFDSVKLNNDIKRLLKPEVTNEMCNVTVNKKSSSRNILDYLKSKYSNLDSSYSVLILNKYACSSCNEYLIQFLSLNSFLLKMKKSALRFIYITNEKSVAEQYFKKLKIENVVIGDPKGYNQYHPFKFYNPRFILIKDNKIISDTIYMPSELEKLLERLLDFYGVKTE